MQAILILTTSCCALIVETQEIYEALVQTHIKHITNPHLFLLIKGSVLFWSLLCLFTLIKGTFSDPGYIPFELKPPPTDKVDDKQIRICKICNTWKPLRAHHCSTCERCVFRMDHHCDWFNTCVGIQNQKLFILFLTYTAIYCLLAATLMLIKFGLNLGIHGLSVFARFFVQFSWDKLTSLLLAVFALFFLFLTLDFLHEQLTCIADNQTVIESLKDIGGAQKHWKDSFEDILGVRSLHWILPTKAKCRINYMEKVFRYAYNDDKVPESSDMHKLD